MRFMWGKACAWLAEGQKSIACSAPLSFVLGANSMGHRVLQYENMMKDEKPTYAVNPNSPSDTGIRRTKSTRYRQLRLEPRSLEGSRWRGSGGQRWIFALTERVRGGEGIEGDQQHMRCLRRERVCGGRHVASPILYLSRLARKWQMFELVAAYNNGDSDGGSRGDSVRGVGVAIMAADFDWES